MDLPNLIPFRKGKKWGFCNKSKDIIIECEYKNAKIINDNIYLVDYVSKIIIKTPQGFSTPLTFRSFMHLSDGLGVGKGENGLYGIIDEYGKLIHDFTLEYDKVSQFRHNMAIVTKDVNEVGDYKWKERWIPSIQEELLYSENNNKRKNHKFGFINSNGKEIVPVFFDNATNFSKFVSGVSIGGKWMFIDKKGEKISDKLFDSIYDLTPEWFLVSMQNLYGLYDEMGIEVLPIEFSNISIVTGTKNFTITKNRKVGFYSHSSKFYLEPTYDGLRFSTTEILFKKDEKYGYLDFGGNIIIHNKFDMAFDFSEGLAVVKKENEWLIINVMGEVLHILDVQEDYDEIIQDPDICFSEGFLRIVQNNKFGFLNRNFQISIPCIYDYAFNFIEGLACVEKDNLFGFINTKREVAIPVKYYSFQCDLEEIYFVRPQWKRSLLEVYGPPVSSHMGLETVGSFIGYIDKEGNEYWEDDNTNPQQKNIQQTAISKSSDELLEADWTHLDTGDDDLPF